VLFFLLTGHGMVLFFLLTGHGMVLFFWLTGHGMVFSFSVAYFISIHFSVGLLLENF